MTDAKHLIRIARTSRDLTAAERFYIQGPGLSLLFRKAADEGYHLLMLGPDLETTTATAFVLTRRSWGQP